MALLQEPWIIGGKVAGLKPQQGSVLYSKSATRPRTCIVYSNRVNCMPIPRLCNNDFVTATLSVTTEEGVKRWIICSAYFPGDEGSCPPQMLSDIVAYCVENRLQLIVGCDANAHHVIWGSTNINPRGESLWQFILGEGLSVANIGNKPTFVTTVRREVLDLTICSMNASDSIINWHVSQEPSCSDHRHIRFDLTTPTLMERKFRNPK